jgi:predicted nicotinamide N-methyase
VTGLYRFALKGKRVIELGAGTGVVGLAAGALGAKVVLTDLPHLLPGLTRNVEVGCTSLTWAHMGKVYKASAYVESHRYWS